MDFYKIYADQINAVQLKISKQIHIILQTLFCRRYLTGGSVVCVIAP